MASPLGNLFSINEKVIAQADFKLLGLTFESLIVEFN